MQNQLNITERTKVKRVPTRGNYDCKVIYDIIDEAYVCHVGFHTSDGVAVIPTAHWRMENHLYVHGSTASRMIKCLLDKPACIAITLLDGLVLARSAFHHSMNYRSVVIYGQGKLVEEPQEKLVVLEKFVEHIAPGRWAEVKKPSKQELKGTSVVAFDLEEASAKIRTGPPVDDKEDYSLPIWAGEIPLHLHSQNPIADPLLIQGVSLPKYLQ